MKRVTTPGLLGACARLIELLDTLEDVPFLSPLIQREIVYRILRTRRRPRPGRQTPAIGFR